MSTKDPAWTALATDVESIVGGFSRRRVAKPFAGDETRGPPILRLLVLAGVPTVGAALAAFVLPAPMLRPASGTRPVASRIHADVSARPNSTATEPIEPVQTAALTTAGPALPPAPVPSPAPAPPTASRPVPAAVPEARPATRAVARRSSPDRSAAASPIASREPAKDRDICHDAPDPDWCLYREVRIAGMRLRDAYESAMDFAIPVAEMRRVRRAWNRALERSPDDPVGTVRMLDALTAQLDEEHDRLLDDPRR